MAITAKVINDILLNGKSVSTVNGKKVRDIQYNDILYSLEKLYSVDCTLWFHPDPNGAGGDPYIDTRLRSTSFDKKDIYEFINYKGANFSSFIVPQEILDMVLAQVNDSMIGTVINAKDLLGTFAPLFCYPVLGLAYFLNSNNVDLTSINLADISMGLSGSVNDEASGTEFVYDCIPILSQELLEAFSATGNFALFNNQIILISGNIYLEGEALPIIYILRTPVDFSVGGQGKDFLEDLMITQLRQLLYQTYTMYLSNLVGVFPILDTTLEGTPINIYYLYSGVFASTPPMLKYVKTEETETIHWQFYNNNEVIEETPLISTVNNFNITGQGEVNKYDAGVANYIAPTESERGSVDLHVYELTCLSGDTLITMADGSYKRLDKIQEGDYVKVSNGGNERVIFSDSHIQKIKNQYTIYTFNNNISLTVIKDHRVFSLKKKKFVHISTLDIGDKILGENDTILELIDKQIYNTETRHYTIFTDDTNAYYANGVVCGNIFANIKIKWLRKLMLKMFDKIYLPKERKKYE